MLQIPKPTRRGLVVVLAFALLAGVVPATLRPLTASASTASQSDSTVTPSSQTADASTTPDANAMANTSITPTVSYGTSSAGGSFAPSVLFSTLYCVTALPPSLCGVLHVSVIVVEPGVAASDNGADGEVVAAEVA